MILDQLAPSDLRRLRAFRRVARKYCRAIEHAADHTEVEFLRTLNDLIAELWWRGQQLPDLDPWEDEPDDDEEEPPDGDEPNQVLSQTLPEPDLDVSAHLADHWKAHSLLQPILASHDYHRLVFDPYSPDDRQRESVTASLSNHLADIYAGIKENLRDDHESTRDDAFEPPYVRAWQWRFSFYSHWGLYHLLPAMNAIAWLLSSYWNDDYGWEEVWQPPPNACELPKEEA